MPDAETRLIEPPAPLVTPAVAKRWLHRTYPPLAELTAYAAWPQIFTVRGIGLRGEERELVPCGLRGLAIDVRRITEVCGKVLATGRPIEMQLREQRWNYRKLARELRAVLKYELRHPARGTRLIIRRALRRVERLAAPQPRSWGRL